VPSSSRPEEVAVTVTDVPTVPGLDDGGVLSVGDDVLGRLLAEVRARHPRKSFGYLISDSATGRPTDFVLFEENIRNESGWRESFEAYGDYFVLHPDAGFVATADEAWRVEKEILRRGAYEVGVFHSHQRHPANFSRIDYDLHLTRFDALWHMIISMRNPEIPVVRVFAPTRSGTREIPLRVLPDQSEGVRTRVPDRAAREDLRSLLALDAAGRPACTDAAAVLSAVARVSSAGDPELPDALLTRGLLRGSGSRFDDLVAPHLRSIPAVRFSMGSDLADPANFCGETPRHPVALSPYRMAATPVTVEEYAVLDPGRRVAGPAGRLPVTGVSWAEASLYALWVGARLPTEAQWEYACGVDADTEWCCATEAELRRYAWFCANSGGRLHPVGERLPNRLGLHDLHGNVWEWCRDPYDPASYARGPSVDPGAQVLAGDHDRVTRGGSYQGLPEMCRTRYRFHEPPALRAADLGFRLVCDG
jgi:formylglycine-generating enzyme required for sulfatase activity/proteasome lid subunit RPN8/RPN11